MNGDKPKIGPEVPKAVVSRLSLYLRELQHLLRDGKETVSSKNLGRGLGISDAQVRKDFTYFGQFGYPGVGYRCNELVREIRQILGTNQVWPLAILGCGNLGQALIGYQGFSKQGFCLAAAFDTDPEIIGQTVEGVEIQPLSELTSIAAELQIRLAILAVPAKFAEDAVTAIVAAGITGILNFAPVTLSVPKTVNVVDVDLAMELEQLAFAVVRNETKK